MGILFVCHSAGDTEIIMDTAQKVVSKTKDAIYILTVGKTAATKVSTDPLLKSKQVHWIKLSDILSPEEVIGLENTPLSSSQVDAIQTYLAPFNIERALFGTPSQLNAAAPFQIAKRLSATLESGIIYNDYLFYEEKHSFWEVVKQKKLWQTKYKWFVPTPAAKTLIDSKLNNGEKSPTGSYPRCIETKTLAVGHRAIDATTHSEPLDEKKINEWRSQLNITPKQTLIFVSGTKNTEDDKTLLRSLLTSINSGYGVSGHEKIEVRLGLHPGHTDLITYIQGMTSVIDEFKETRAANQVQFIVPSSLKDKVSSLSLESSLFCFSDLSGDDSTLASDGVACSMPATLTNKAALLGKPALYYQDKTPFLPGERLFGGPKYIDLFFKRALDKKPRFPVTKEELALSSTEVTEAIATALLEKTAKPTEKKPPEKKKEETKTSATKVAFGIGVASLFLTVTGFIVAKSISEHKKATPSMGRF